MCRPASPHPWADWAFDADHAKAAFSASFYESMCTAREVWAENEEVKGNYNGEQKFASYKIDKAIHEGLVEHTPTRRERQRLLRVTELHAGAFVTALPSTDDGMDTVMRPEHFHTAVAYRLGVPVVEDGVHCPLCRQTVDVFGDHASCCSRNGGLIVRHNRVRNLVMRFCKEGLLSPILEKQGILRDVPGRRPGDVTLPVWRNDRGLHPSACVRKHQQMPMR